MFDPVSDLGDNEFTGEVPDGIYTLRTLELLLFDDNNLAGGIKGDISNLAALTEL